MSKRFPKHPELMEGHLGPAAWPGQDSLALEVPSMVLSLLGRRGIALGCPQMEDFFLDNPGTDLPSDLG